MYGKLNAEPSYTLLGFSPDNSGTRHTQGPPSQDLTSGWKQPQSDNKGGKPKKQIYA